MFSKVLFSRVAKTRDYLVMGKVNCTCETPVNFLPNNKILDWSKFKAFAEEKFYIAKMMISVCDRVENIVRKGENAGY